MTCRGLNFNGYSNPNAQNQFHPHARAENVDMSRRRAVITGIGPITCIGRSRENFWNAILAEKSGISRISSFDPSPFQVRCAGEILDWKPEEFFPPQRLKRLDRYAQFAVASAQLALDDVASDILANDRNSASA